jgi:DNA-binding winged helix-turn-helix (wHTH) protein/tetratricopeptide (TPR) repeat protein
VINPAADKFLLGDWQVDPLLSRIAKQDTAVSIDRRNMDVLVLLAKKAGTVASQRTIEKEVWRGTLVTANSVYQSITQLRRALGDDVKQPRYIQTVARKGYRLIAPVTAATNVTAAAGNIAAQTQSCALDAVAQPTTDEQVAGSPPVPVRGLGSRLSNRSWVRGIQFTAMALALALAVALSAGLRNEPYGSLPDAEQVGTPPPTLVAAANDAFAARLAVDKELLGLQPSANDLQIGKLESLGIMYLRYGWGDQALDAFRQAIALRQPSTHWLLSALALVGAAHVERSIGELNESDRDFEAAKKLYSEHEAERSLRYATLVWSIGNLERRRGNTKEAEPLVSTALRLAYDLNLNGLVRSDIADMQITLASVAYFGDQDAVAEQLCRAALEIYRETLSDKDPMARAAASLLAMSLGDQHRNTEAAEILEHRLVTKVDYNDNEGIIDTLTALAKIRFSQERVAEAEQLTRRALTLAPRGHHAVGIQSAVILTSLGKFLLFNHQLPQAESFLREALQLTIYSDDRNISYTAAAEHYLGEVLLAQDQLAEAERHLSNALEHLRAAEAADWRTARSLNALGELRHRQGRDNEAEPLLVDSYKTLSAAGAVDSLTKKRAGDRVAQFYRDRGQPVKLELLGGTEPPST